MKCLDFQSCAEAFLFSVGRVLYAVLCVYLYTNSDSTGKQVFFCQLAARESTPPKRNCVANFAPVKACCVLAVENLSLF